MCAVACSCPGGKEAERLHVLLSKQEVPAIPARASLHPVHHSRCKLPAMFRQLCAMIRDSQASYFQQKTIDSLVINNLLFRAAAPFPTALLRHIISSSYFEHHTIHRQTSPSLHITINKHGRLRLPQGSRAEEAAGRAQPPSVGQQGRFDPAPTRQRQEYVSNILSPSPYLSPSNEHSSFLSDVLHARSILLQLSSS